MHFIKILLRTNLLRMNNQYMLHAQIPVIKSWFDYAIYNLNKKILKAKNITNITKYNLLFKRIEKE